MWKFSERKRARGAGRLVASIFLPLLLLPGCTRPHQDALERFAESYIQNHRAGDIEGLVDLVLLPENEPEVRRFVQIAFAEEVRWPLRDLQVEVLPNDERQDLGERFPLEPIWRVLVILDTEDRFTSEWFAGFRDGKVFLLVEEGEGIAQPPDPRRSGRG